VHHALYHTHHPHLHSLPPTYSTTQFGFFLHTPSRPRTQHFWANNTLSLPLFPVLKDLFRGHFLRLHIPRSISSSLPTLRPRFYPCPPRTRAFNMEMNLTLHAHLGQVPTSATFTSCNIRGPPRDTTPPPPPAVLFPFPPRLLSAVQTHSRRRFVVAGLGPPSCFSNALHGHCFFLVVPSLQLPEVVSDFFPQSRSF